MMDIKVYGRRGCPDCDKTHLLLETMELPYQYYDIHASEENFKELESVMPAGHSTVPVILIDGEFIDGYNELRKRLAK